MNWETLIPIIIKFGVKEAYSMWQVFSKHPEPTEEAWAELKARADVSLADKIAARQAEE